MKERVIEALGKIRPMLQRDGGDVKLMSVSENGIVTVELQGACAGCPGAKMTLKGVIERILKDEIPEIKEVIGV